MGVTLGGDQLLSQSMTFNAQMPKEGPLAIPVALPFQTATVVEVDFTYQMQQGRISALQGLMVRNWNNADPITIVIQGTNEYLDVPAYCDIFLQIACTNRAKLVFTSAGGVSVPCVFFNVPISPLLVYSPNGGSPVIITGTIDVDVVNTVTVQGTVVADQPSLGTLAASATVVATGGTAVNAFVNPTVPVRIINPTNATEELFVNCITNAGTVEGGGNVGLNPGAGITFPAMTGTISVNAVSNSHTFTAYGPAGGGGFTA